MSNIMFYVIMFYSLSSYAETDDFQFDTGLIGPLVICKKGSLKSNGNPIGYDAERYILMAVMDENKSWYLDANMAKYCLAANCFDVDKGINQYAKVFT